MEFRKALECMMQGQKVKLPSWGGYWAWENDTIMMHTKDGAVINLLDTKLPEYTFRNMASNEFMVADVTNTPILGREALFGFGDAINYLKRGLKVARKGWNGKSQYIQLATGISYKDASGEVVNCEHEAIGNMAIAFVGTSGVQMGWLASQADMLANDWKIVE